jgi:hypothetical protein
VSVSLGFVAESAVFGDGNLVSCAGEFVDQIGRGPYPRGLSIQALSNTLVS